MDELKKAAIEAAVSRLVAKIVSVAPFFGLSIVNPLLAYFLSKFFSLFIDEVQLLAELGFIEIKVNSQIHRAEEVAVELKKQLEGPRDEEALSRAREEFKKRYRDLIRIDP